MPRRLHAGHLALAGLLVLWGVVSLFSGGQSQSFGDGERFGTSVSDGDSWKFVDSGDHTMEIEGWGRALFVWSLTMTEGGSGSGKDLWLLEQQASVIPEARDGRRDPVVSRIRMRGYPTAKTAPVFDNYLEWSEQGGGPDALTLDDEVIGDIEFLVDEGRFGGAAGERFAQSSVMFTVDQGERPRFHLEREIAFRSGFGLGSRSCASAGDALDPAADSSPECVVEGRR